MSDNLLELAPQERPIVFGETFWLDDDDLSLSQQVRNLIAEEKLAPSKYTLPIPYLSVSQLNTFLSCPKQYEFKYIHGMDTKGSCAMAQGKTLHQVVEAGYKFKRMNGSDLPTDEFIKDTHADAFKANFEGDELPRLDWETNDFYRVQGEVLIKAWYKDKLPKVSPLAIEQKFVVSINGVPFVGIIDLIDRINVPPQSHLTRYHPLTDVVVDNKVVAKAMSQSDADNSLQMTIYSAATKLPAQRYDLFIKGNPASILQAGSKAKGPRLGEIETLRRRGQHHWAAVIVEDVAKTIQSGIFTACAPDSWVCNAKWCQAWSQCRGCF